VSMLRSTIAGLIAGLIFGATLVATARTPTYREDVRPILDKNCLGCHSPGGKGHLPLWTYSDAQEYAKQIAAVVTGKTMPPQHYGVLGEGGTLGKADVDTIVQWVAAGTPEGAAK